MKSRLVEFLRCPITGEKLHLTREKKDDNTGEILSGFLETPSGKSYPIEAGVPILIDFESFVPGQAETVDTFSEKWSRAPGYREATQHHYVSWYLERYGFQTIEGLRAFLSQKKFILEAGTGEGRDAQLYAENSTAEVFAIDISTGINIAYRDLGTIPNLHFIRADLQRLPFAPDFFDFIACDQVIHHTPDTAASLKALVRHLGNGHIAFYVYKVKGPIREFCDTFIREKTTQMSPEACMEFSEAMTHLGKSLTEQNISIDIPVDIPLLGIDKGKFDLQRWLYWNVFKCYWNNTIDWSSNAVTNFDWYHPLHAHRHTPEEVESWLNDNNLSVEHFSVVESGISTLARRHK